jgi:hypothetical protein
MIARYRPAAARRLWGPPLRALVTLLAGVALWYASVGAIDIRLVNDYGLISLVTPWMILGTALIGLGFVLILRLQPLPIWLAVAAALLVILTIHALPSLIEDAPRFSVSYLHAGFTEEIARRGELLPNVDARFSWPLFFTLGAFVTSVAGIANAIAFQPWAAVVFNLMYLVPLVVIFRALTPDRRLVATATFVFFAANWIGQDYYAPQALNMLFYLTVLAIVLRWFGTTHVPSWVRRVVEFLDARWPWLRRPMRDASVSPARSEPPRIAGRQRAALLFVIILVSAASVASHQLTPFALLAALTALTVIGRNQLRGLPLLLAVMIGMWISYMTVVFLAGNLAGLLEAPLAPAQAASANVGQRLTGSAGHLFVVRARLAYTVLLWGLAAFGALRRYRWGNLDLEAIALAGVPFGLILLQAYGGEMLLRIYLFSLPFVSFLVAGLFFPSPARPFTPAATRTLSAVLAVLLIGLIITKHGNERAEYISADELAAIDRLYATAPVGSTIGAINENSPSRYRLFEQYRYVTIQGAFLAMKVDAIRDALNGPDGCGFLFVTHSQEAAAELFSRVPASLWQRAETALIESGDFVPVYANRDATIYLTTPSRPACRSM